VRIRMPRRGTWPESEHGARICVGTRSQHDSHTDGALWRAVVWRAIAWHVVTPGVKPAIDAAGGTIVICICGDDPRARVMNS